MLSALVAAAPGVAHAEQPLEGDEVIESRVKPPPPPPEPDRVMRSKGAFITGTVLMSMGVLMGAGAGAMLGTVYAEEPADRDARESLGITSAVGAVALLGVGVPLMIWGAREPTLDNSATVAPGPRAELYVAPTRATLTVSF